jgi:DNA-binding MarR family transcriptional regulator
MDNTDDRSDEATARPDGDTDAALDRAGQALFRLGRLFARRTAHNGPAERAGRPVELSRILVAEAVAVGPDEPEGEITVGLIADRLAIEPSTASRLVAEAIREGYVTRTTSPTDARRLRLDLTPAGRALVADAQRYQRATFEEITCTWPTHDRAEFARLLVRFTDTLAERLSAPEKPSSD